MMIRIAMAGFAPEEEGERLWFNRAVVAQVDWPASYVNLLWALRPRWGGSHEAMYRFGLECSSTGRYDTDVPYQLVQALLDIAEDAEGSFVFWSAYDVYPAAGEVLVRLAAEPRNAHRANYYRTIAAGMAWGSRRYEESRRIIAELGNEFDGPALEKELHVSRRTVLDDVTVFTSPVALPVLESDEAMRNGRAALAAERIEAALAGTSDESVAAVLRDRLVTAQQYRDFLAGGWVALSFEKGLPGWRARRGAWHASTSASIKGGPKGEGMRLVCQVPVGDRFQLRGRINPDKLIARNHQANAGIVFRFREHFDRSDWQSFLLYDAQKRAWIGYRQEGAEGEYVPLKARARKPLDFDLQVWGEGAVLAVNGEQVFAGRVGASGDFHPGELFGLTGAYGDVQGYARFENLQLRRLAKPPEALVASLEAADEPADQQGEAP
jgi:hypothetical protein